jgi:hypothetical protein
MQLNNMSRKGGFNPLYQISSVLGGHIGGWEKTKSEDSGDA